MKDGRGELGEARTLMRPLPGGSFDGRERMTWERRADELSRVKQSLKLKVNKRSHSTRSTAAHKITLFVTVGTPASTPLTSSSSQEQ